MNFNNLLSRFVYLMFLVTIVHDGSIAFSDLTCMYDAKPSFSQTSSHHFIVTGKKHGLDKKKSIL